LFPGAADLQLTGRKRERGYQRRNGDPGWPWPSGPASSSGGGGGSASAESPRAALNHCAKAAESVLWIVSRASGTPMEYALELSRVMENPPPYSDVSLPSLRVACMLRSRPDFPRMRT